MRPMQIVVCLKPVPDPKHWQDMSLDPVTKTLRRTGIPSVIDPLGKNALEEALRIMQGCDGKVVVVSMAPPQTVDVLREVLAMGASSAVLLSDRSFAGADTLATSYVLSLGIRKLGTYDLVICGGRSLDGGTAQVGPQLAEFLDVPHVTRVNRVEFVADTAIRVRAKLDHGYQIVEAKLPALLTVEKDINVPRLKSLMGIIQARNRTIEVWDATALRADAAAIGAAGSPTQVADVFMADLSRRGETIAGPPEEAARSLVGRLRALGAV